ncbi:hypothetical protein ACJMK2_003401 [Sinanodonta woodiana]|uniref:Uncharacterized protein n=1 Tax=Sinanodonta woodiana TaxID=1069815 RepID=A0ABD3Y0G0_SINWO
MASSLPPNRELILKRHFRTVSEDTEEGRIIHAFLDDFTQEINFSQIRTGSRPNPPTLLALLIAKGIDQAQIDTLTSAGKGTFLLYPKEEKVFLLSMGQIQLGESRAMIYTPPHY